MHKYWDDDEGYTPVYEGYIPVHKSYIPVIEGYIPVHRVYIKKDIKDFSGYHCLPATRYNTFSALWSLGPKLDCSHSWSFEDINIDTMGN